MMMFFPKKASCSLTFQSILLPFLSIFLASYPNCSATCQVSIPPFQTLIHLLYYTTAGGERRHANVKVVGWRAALLQRGDQAIDKERDIMEAKSDARVLSSGLT